MNAIVATDDALDISEASISNIQSITAANVTLTASELGDLTTLSADNLYAATAGSYSIADLSSNIQMNDIASGGGVTLTGNNTADEILTTTQNNDMLITGTGTSDNVMASGANDVVTVNGTDATATLTGANDIITANGSIANGIGAYINLEGTNIRYRQSFGRL